MLVSILLASSFAIGATVPVEEEEMGAMSLSSAPLVAHDPIKLLNDTDLMDQASSEGWPGSGTPYDPIVIEGLEIDSDAYPASFYAQHISLSVLIRDCTIISTPRDGDATAILDVVGMRFENVTMEACNALVAMECSKISLVGCSLTGGAFETTGSSYVVAFDSCQDVTLSGNQFDELSYSRVYFIYCENVQIDNNTLNACCLSQISSEDIQIADNMFLDSETFGVYLLNTDQTALVRNQFIGGETGLMLYELPGVPTTNTSLVDNVFENGGLLFQVGSSVMDTFTTDGDLVNGRPLYLLKDVDMQGGLMPDDMGQYLLLRVKNGVFHGLDIELNCGIHLCECENMTVRHSTFQNILGYGVSILQSNDTLIQDCVFLNSSDSVWGIGLDMEVGNVNTTIVDCQFTDCVQAILDSYGQGLNVSGNTIVGGTFGINLGSESNVTIVDNVIEDTGTGIVIAAMNPLVVEMSSENVQITGNVLTDCWVGLELSTSREITVWDNEILDSEDSGIVILGMLRNTTISNNWIEGSQGFAIRVLDWDIAPNNDLVLHSNAFMDNNGAGTTYDPSHVQVDDYGDSGANWSIETDHGRQGNFWSDLSGPEEDRSGFLAVPYVIVEGEISDPRPFATMTPYEPQQLGAKVASGKVNLTWNAPEFEGMSEITGYEVMLKVNGSWSRLAMVTGTSYVHEDVHPGESYEYAVMAINEYGDGLLSEPADAHMPSAAADMIVLVLFMAIVLTPIGLIFILNRN